MFHEPDGAWTLEPTSDEAGQTVRLDSYEGGVRAALRKAVADGNWRMPALVFVVGLLVFSAFAWDRLGGPSEDPHFAYLANTYNSMISAAAGNADAVERRSSRVPFELERNPPHGNDWASYWEIELKDGTTHRGIWLDKQGTGRFRLLGTNEAVILDHGNLRGAKRKQRYFVSFPPGPAVVMMPFAAVWGYDVNDVLITVLFAALNMALMFILLRRLSRGGRTGRGRSEVLWLTALFGFGTVHLWCSVLGQVWFSALVIGATFTLLYMICAIDARHPLLAGIFCAAAFATRTPLLFSCVFFYAFLLFPGGKLRRDNWGDAAKRFALFSLPCLVVGLTLLSMNEMRFGEHGEFGHTYLARGTLARIKSYGLFNFHFLSKNLSALFTLLPRLQPAEPYIVISKHGMSILLTTPAFVWLAWPLARDNHLDRFWHRLLWGTIIIVGAPALLYQNTGFEQFGYRFSLDYTPYLVALLAVGRRPLSRAFKVAVVAGIAVNAFGAVTFKRFNQFYSNEFFP